MLCLSEVRGIGSREARAVTAQCKHIMNASQKHKKG